MEQSGVKLTKAQAYQLRITRDVGGGWYPGPGGGGVACAALVRKGLMFKHGPYGPYSLTPAGLAALSPENDDGR
jgi:hypothetical protein